MFCMPPGSIILPQREPRVRPSRSAPHGGLFCSCGFVYHINTSPGRFTVLCHQHVSLAFRVQPPANVEVFLLECPLCLERRFDTEPPFVKARADVHFDVPVCDTDIVARLFVSTSNHLVFVLKILNTVMLVGCHVRGMLVFASDSFPLPITALGDSHSVCFLNSRAVVFPVECKSPGRAWAARQRFAALCSAALLTWWSRSTTKPSQKRTRVKKRRTCRTPSRAFLEDDASTTDRIIHHALTALPPGLLRHILEFV